MSNYPDDFNGITNMDGEYDCEADMEQEGPLVFSPYRIGECDSCWELGKLDEDQLCETCFKDSGVYKASLKHKVVPVKPIKDEVDDLELRVAYDNFLRSPQWKLMDFEEFRALNGKSTAGEYYLQSLNADLAITLKKDAV